MKNIERLKKTFKDALELNDKINIVKLEYQDSGWDSVAHMALVAAIEQKFDIMLDTDDVIDMSSFVKAKEIITKYGVDINA